jgi:hypothetical protein
MSGRASQTSVMATAVWASRGRHAATNKAIVYVQMVLSSGKYHGSKNTRFCHYVTGAKARRFVTTP